MRIALVVCAAILGCDDPGVAPNEHPTEPIEALSASEVAESEQAPAPVPTPEDTAPQTPVEAQLVTSTALLETLVGLESTSTPESEFGQLFATLVEDSAPLCRHMHTEASVSDALIKRYIAPAGAYKGAPLRTRRSMIAGCWNFVQMNDREPEHDLELVAALYGADSYDCTSVGVMQPYLMQHILGCSRLTMLDFDWQIHRVHAQLLDAMRREQFGEELDPVLATMQVDWIAYHKPRESHPLSLAALCRSETTQLCAEALRHSQARLPALEGMTFALAGLHEAPFEPVPASQQRVVYLSNALERAYTSREEFHAMMDRLAAAMRDDEVALLIHHAGGQPSFGIYEVRLDDEGWTVSTRCRDLYATSVTESETGTYETWLEGVTENPKPVPTCAELLRDADIGQG